MNPIIFSLLLFIVATVGASDGPILLLSATCASDGPIECPDGYLCIPYERNESDGPEVMVYDEGGKAHGYFFDMINNDIENVLNRLLAIKNELDSYGLEEEIYDSIENVLERITAIKADFRLFRKLPPRCVIHDDYTACYGNTR